MNFPDERHPMNLPRDPAAAAEFHRILLDALRSQALEESKGTVVESVTVAQKICTGCFWCNGGTLPDNGRLPCPPKEIIA
jgi:hypothetical protein